MESGLFSTLVSSLVKPAWRRKSTIDRWCTYKQWSFEGTLPRHVKWHEDSPRPTIAFPSLSAWASPVFAQMNKTKINLGNTRHSLTFLLAHHCGESATFRMWFQWRSALLSFFHKGQGAIPVIFSTGHQPRGWSMGWYPYHCDNCCYRGHPQSPAAQHLLSIATSSPALISYCTEYHQPTSNQLWTIVSKIIN